MIFNGFNFKSCLNKLLAEIVSFKLCSSVAAELEFFQHPLLKHPCKDFEASAEFIKKSFNLQLALIYAAMTRPDAECSRNIV